MRRCPRTHGSRLAESDLPRRRQGNSHNTVATKIRLVHAVGMASRRDFEELERRRMLAAALFSRGETQASVVRELGVVARPPVAGMDRGRRAVLRA